MPEPAHVLLVAHQTAATAELLDVVRERARRAPATFHLVVPSQPHGMHKVVDPEDAGGDEAQAVLESALPKLSEAAGAEVTGSIGDAEPLMAIEDAINLGDYDEIIISTLPRAGQPLAEARPGEQSPGPRAARHARGNHDPLPSAGGAGLARREAGDVSRARRRASGRRGGP